MNPHDLFRKRIHPWLETNATLLGAYRSVTALILFPIAIIAGVYSIRELTQALSPPQVALVVANPKTGATASVWNTSNEVADDPSYFIVLFNIDDPTEPWQPLPVPSATNDRSIRPGKRWGPNPLLGVDAVARRLQPGNRLLGFGRATCSDCPRRPYWLYIEHGASGWSAEMKSGISPAVPRVFALAKEPAEMLAAFRAAVPEADRVPLPDSDEGQTESGFVQLSE